MESGGSAVKASQDGGPGHRLDWVGEDFADLVGLVGFSDLLQFAQVGPEADVLVRLVLRCVVVGSRGLIL
ncbi:hypothetical protein OHB54_44585 [Streptomyces sp. NBC_01007]|nr:hypothetical protein OHB54_44585 [Streptomyces sp. NBC_01007]